MKRKTKLISLLLIICMCISVMGGVASTAVTPSDAAVQAENSSVEEFVVPDIVDEAERIEYGYVGRVKDAEQDLNTFVFRNEDGTNTMRIYSHPVKYVTEDGLVRDISLAVKAKNDGGFVTADHEIMTTFERELSNGISLAYHDVAVTLVPDVAGEASPVAALSGDGKIVTYGTNDTTSFVYELTYAGFKEDIVVNEYTGQTEYDFTLCTNGLTLSERYGSFYLVDDENNVKATIGDIIVFTADERNNTMGRMSFETIRENQEYKLTIHLDEDYLADEKTAYPIRIDPSIEINYDNNGAGAIEDVTINSLQGSDGSSSSLFVGRRNTYGISRVLMRFPNLSLRGIAPAQITAATVEIRDVLCQGDEDITVECRIYNTSAPAWSESGSTSWSSVGTSYVGSLLDSHVISYGNGNVGAHRYSFNILAAAKLWADETQSPAKGLVFKANDAFENQTGADVKTWNKTFASYNRGGNRPSFSVTYTDGVTRNMFYSTYEPNRFNATTIPNGGSYTDLIRYRMNCYGYAFGFIRDRSVQTWENSSYKQQPGEFALTADKGKTLPVVVEDDPKATMTNVINNMKLDAARWGYTVSGCAPLYAEIGDTGTTARVIALVTGGNDYHFYMRHSDGTWSHKPGSDSVSNLSISSQVPLTNENIQRCANEGRYADGELRFFVITKPAVIDYPHGERCCSALFWPCSHTQIPLYPQEKAGDNLQTACTKYVGNTSGRIDYADDHDFYCFIPSATRTYTIKTTCATDADLDCKVYNNAGIVCKSMVNSGQVNASMRLVAGQPYYFDVYNYSKTVTDYVFTIS